MTRKAYIKTEIENIFRVIMYAPRGFCLPPLFHSIHNHKAFNGDKRIKMREDLIYYIFEFKDIVSNKQNDIRKFCRDSMRKDMIPIEMYNKIYKKIFPDSEK